MNTKYHIDYKKEERECGKCRTVLPFSKFYLTDDGRPQSYCKICKNEYIKVFQQKQRDDLKEKK